MAEEGGPQSIIIVKKKVDGEGDHHGGVWKLAFADFMTAMFTFFLVMWILNVTPKETKAVIVQYFNPVQLIDANPAHRGFKDPKEASGQGKNQKEPDEPAKDPMPDRTDLNADIAEAKLLKNPQKALDDIAKRDSPPDTSAPTFNDPFDRGEQSSDKPATPDSDEKRQSTQNPPTPKGATKTKDGAATGESSAAQQNAAATLKTSIEKIVKLESLGLKGVPHVEVSQTDEGVLISLTDDANFSMFGIGSVEPKPQLVRIMGQIGKILQKQAGDIEIRGHTDGRVFKARNYDNWRLSSERAHIANFMLVRGGLAPERISRIVGYADRRLKVPKDPMAALNRRIEILIRGDKR